jgi:hypothetical protein
MAQDIHPVHTQSYHSHTTVPQPSSKQILRRLRRNHRRRRLLLLLLILNLLHILLRHIILLRHPLEHLIAHISLNRNLLPTTRSLRNRAARREFLSELFRSFLEVDVEVLES